MLGVGCVLDAGRGAPLVLVGAGWVLVPVGAGCVLVPLGCVPAGAG